MNSYLLFKSLHLIAVVSWMAGLLYLPRIFVYHAENSSEKKTSEIFKTMERKLFFYIMTPAMILSWIFGLILIPNMITIEHMTIKIAFYLLFTTLMRKETILVRLSPKEMILQNFFLVLIKIYLHLHRQVFQLFL